MSLVKNRTKRYLPVLVGTASITCLVLIWEYFAGSNTSALAAVLPPPSHFLGVIAQSDFRIGMGSQSTPVGMSVLATFMRVFSGLFIAFIAAIITAMLLSLSKIITWVLSPIIYLLSPIAPIAWIPTAITLLGIGNATAIFIVFMGVYFILTIGTLAEIRRLPEEFHIVADDLGAGPWQRWLWVVLPAILPGTFTLLRTNFIAAWMAVLVAEMVGLHDGMGAIIMMGRNLFNNDLIMFGMVMIGLSGFVVDRILAFIGKHLLWWRVS
ncbi:TPA: ABC transporter permease subunit [Klebsiella variicola]|uniref:ABC transporter permease n=1 Tax=Klebsiella pneumoniae TaxID=573 RepID=UPI0015EA065C|nr:ABC transporter permease subunit [Klebsiella pneumoniae]EIY5386269.1 ABC transporter permease subunit [Klebsiella variicola]MDU4203454.1 ABC transporter permease subunit [Negativicoccus succinicivorans]MDU4248818.1 ABC transporter permease subunit [Thomasclavelia ramosa]QLR70894.1 ABC transporter permease subunit [Klebsiella pneumoniae]QLR70978.1 ABC transporter permease subunit [Klebsiella pneumoniae]